MVHTASPAIMHTIVHHVACKDIYFPAKGDSQGKACLVVQVSNHTNPSEM